MKDEKGKPRGRNGGRPKSDRPLKKWAGLLYEDQLPVPGKHVRWCIDQIAARKYAAQNEVLLKEYTHKSVSRESGIECDFVIQIGYDEYHLTGQNNLNAFVKMLERHQLTANKK